MAIREIMLTKDKMYNWFIIPKMPGEKIGRQIECNIMLVKNPALLRP
jgi:hypothetical protein